MTGKYWYEMSSCDEPMDCQWSVRVLVAVEQDLSLSVLSTLTKSAAGTFCIISINEVI